MNIEVIKAEKLNTGENISYIVRLNVEGRYLEVYLSKYNLMVNLNTPIQKAYKSLGKYFNSFEDAINNYKNDKIKSGLIAAENIIKGL